MYDGFTTKGRANILTTDGYKCTTRKFIAKRNPDDIAISKFDVGLECTTIVQVQLKKNSLKQQLT